MLNKSIIIILVAAQSALLGCTRRSDIKPDMPDSVYTTKQDAKNSLADLEEPFSNFDYKSVLDKYSSTITKDMSVTRFKYFIIFSDLDEKTTYSIIDIDIRNTIDAMVNNYVSVTPDKVTPVFLFTEFETYKEFTLKNTDISESDISPYGYFKISKNIIAIRYVTWKGSPKHEVTHRFTKSDFPNAPSWFDEGLSSMNERSTFKNGNLTADFSWRIIAIRRAINDNKYTGLETLMRTNDEELYGKRTSFYYGQSRYLLGYLQGKGLLEKYYKAFRDTYHNDNTGISQLEKILGKSINEIDEDYYEYITSFKQ